MNPLFFGSSSSPLYGVYVQPKARQVRRTGIVLCYPFGQEYMRAHRAFRQLSLLAAKAGFHVFRFDYSSTGDSAGEADAFTIAQAIDDTSLAIDELRDTADVEQVVLIGLRLGGTIAATVAASRRDVAHVVLWDPIVSGATYLEELLVDARAREQPFGDASASGSGVLGVMGYPLTEVVRSELRSLALSRTALTAIRSGLLMSSADTPLTQDAARSVGLTFRHEPIAGRWDEVDNWGSAMIPQAAIQAIVGWLLQEVA